MNRHKADLPGGGLREKAECNNGEGCAAIDLNRNKKKIKRKKG